VSEAALERACRAHATSRGVRSAKLQGGIVGDPDRVFFLPNERCWLVEFKQLNGRLTPRQKIVHEEYQHLGHPVSVVYTTLQFKVALDLKLQAAVDCRLTT
jgi:hypothetical protein